jgi:hypothetical protein
MAEINQDVKYGVLHYNNPCVFNMQLTNRFFSLEQLIFF